MTKRPTIGWSAREFIWLEAALADENPKQALSDFMEMTGRAQRQVTEKIREMRWRRDLNMPSLVDVALALDHRPAAIQLQRARRKPMAHKLCPRCLQDIRRQAKSVLGA